MLNKQSSLELKFIEIEDKEVLSKYHNLIKELLKYSDLIKIQQAFEILKNQGVRFMGIEHQSKAIGFVQYCISTNLENYKHLRLDEIIVTKKFQGKGIGKQILKYLENIALNNDCEVIFLATGIKNNLAQRFYLNLGYAIGSFYLYKKLD
jgi:GNAT superfamily N-acetyltransferase